jgi:hypothetical protein
MAITTISNRPNMRLFTVLFALAAYLIAFSSAAAITHHLPATPVDVHRRTPLGAGKGSGAGGAGDAGGSDFGSAVDPSKKISSSGPVDKTNDKSILKDGSTKNGASSGSNTNGNIPGGSPCGTGTAVGTMWIAERAYTCAPVKGSSGGNYCISTSLSSYHSGSNLCSKHSDCGSGWCIKVTGAGSACWSSATGCDEYYHGNGKPI